MEQRQRLFKARIALALYARYGRVPKAGEITRAFNSFKTHHADLFTPHMQRHPSHVHEQLSLLNLPPSLVAEHRKTRSFFSLS
jgi:hypothetical protein